MRKIKKINGFLVVRFNDREKRNYPDLGSFGVIDAEQYTGDIDFDRDAMEYTDADCIEVAVEQARGLESESDFSEEPPVCTVIVESDAECSEEEVEPQLISTATIRRSSSSRLSRRERSHSGPRPMTRPPQRRPGSR